MRRVCVFSGSNEGARPDYGHAARALGAEIHHRGLGLVYGGSNRGLMAVVANAVLEAGGDAIGVIPRALKDKEVAHESLTDLHVVESMHERKAKMAELSNAFVAIPGGLGTLEELFEIMTWGQLGFHSKPFGILNVSGFYDPLIRFLDHLVDESFVQDEHRRMLAVSDSPVELLTALEHYVPPRLDKWLDRRSL